MECALSDGGGTSATTPERRWCDGGGSAATVPGRHRQADDRGFSERGLDSARQHHDPRADNPGTALAAVDGERTAALAAVGNRGGRTQKAAGAENPCTGSGAACAGGAEGG